MNKRVVAFLLVVLPVVVFGRCWTTAPYHVAAKAFAEGSGDIHSNSVCKYGNTTTLSDDCPNACIGLIRATWGDCYCQEPEYVPGVSNNLISHMTVLQIFNLFAIKKMLDRRIPLLLLVVLPVLVLCRCWTTAPYHVAAKAYAQGCGDLVSNSVCRYGNDSRLNSICSNACIGLIVATWGDCYCEEPEYVPGVSNALISRLTVRQIFSLFATNSTAAPYANCRDWFNQSGNTHKWQCS